ncbi:MAG: hypothetical protein LBS48_03850 [Treponema sp.]|jgi:hypothetical protein|nr:hypothetical protein [Treponema sp.]
MGRIKSALEIALERTGSVKSDKGSIGQFEAKQNGKKLANRFLGGELKFLEDEIKKAPKDEQISLKQGIFDVLISQITLPAVEEDRKRIESACKGLLAVIGDSRFGGVIKQFSQLLTQYLDETAQYEEAIKRQYAPKLRQKEEELSRRIGRQVQIDPFQDPEFTAFYNQNMNQLKANYQATVDQVREEAERLFSKK